MDRGIIELIGPNGIATLLLSKAELVNQVHLDFIFSYVLFITLGAVFFIYIIGFYSFITLFINPFIIFLTIILIILT